MSKHEPTEKQIEAATMAAIRYTRAQPTEATKTRTRELVVAILTAALCDSEGALGPPGWDHAPE